MMENIQRINYHFLKAVWESRTGVDAASWKTLVSHFLVERLHIVCVLLFTLKISNRTTNSSDCLFLFFLFQFPLCVSLPPPHPLCSN